MRRKPLSILCIILAAVVCFSFTGCSMKIDLKFSNYFLGNVSASEEATMSVNETLTYKVEYQESWHGGYVQKSNNITDDVAKYTFTNGTYVQKLQKGFVPEGVSDVTPSGVVYQLSTNFSIDVEFLLNNKDTVKHTDTIKSDVYFQSAGSSFSPIYSTVKSTNCYLTLTADNSSSSVTIFEFDVETIYNNKTYTINKTIKNLSTDPVSTTSDTTTKEYTMKQLIDNNQLLFIMRNIDVAEQVPSLYPTLSFSYEQPQEIAVYNLEKLTLTDLSLKFNDSQPISEVPVRTLRYLINGTKNAGSSQFISIQDKASEGLPYRALPIQYVETLSAYGSFVSMGALVYTLVDAQVEM